MNFATLTFLLFLPLVFSLYWLIRGRTSQNVLLIVASYLFYGWWDWRFCSLMLISSLIDYLVGRMIHGSSVKRTRRFWLGFSLLTNLGMLGFFKYFNFFADSFVSLAGLVGWELSDVTLRIVLPVGISFYTFQTLSYTLDIYFGKMRPTRSLIDFMAFVSFFPQLVAGPIERAPDLLPQFQNPRKFDYELAKDGLRQMLWGFWKKLIVADRLSEVVDPIYGSSFANAGLQTATGPQIMLATFAFAFQIYCDFSAYSDIAIGTARLFGFQLRRNFAYPFFAQTVGEFWRRWHISLSTWFRDYLFQPLGGVRGTRVLVIRNVMITFVIAGLWHGASWNFIFWGTIMGIGFLPEPLAIFDRRKRKVRAPMEEPGGPDLIPKPRVFIRMVVTFSIFCCSGIFFRSPDMQSAAMAIQRMLADLFNPHAYATIFQGADPNSIRSAPIVIAILLAIEWVQRRHDHVLTLKGWARPWRWVLYTVLVWSILVAMPGDTKGFVYFQF
ncbi:MAG: MBOAT family O-acyltransferase [Phycisphaeraceae bacterium]